MYSQRNHTSWLACAVMAPRARTYCVGDATKVAAAGELEWEDEVLLLALAFSRTAVRTAHTGPVNLSASGGVCSCSSLGTVAALLFSSSVSSGATRYACTSASAMWFGCPLMPASSNVISYPEPSAKDLAIAASFSPKGMKHCSLLTCVIRWRAMAGAMVFAIRRGSHVLDMPSCNSL